MRPWRAETIGSRWKSAYRSENSRLSPALCIFPGKKALQMNSSDPKKYLKMMHTFEIINITMCEWRHTLGKDENIRQKIRSTIRRYSPSINWLTSCLEEQSTQILFGVCSRFQQKESQIKARRQNNVFLLSNYPMGDPRTMFPVWKEKGRGNRRQQQKQKRKKPRFARGGVILFSWMTSMREMDGLFAPTGTGLT